MGISFLFLQPNINVLLNNLVSKESQLDKAAFGILDTRSLIRDTLVEQQTSAKSLGSSVSRSVPRVPIFRRRKLTTIPAHRYS